MRTTLQTRVNKGAKYLDEAQPGWADRIDLPTLQLELSDSCVLGQLYGNYWTGAQKLFGKTDAQKEATSHRLGFTWSSDDDFSYNESNRAWATLNALWKLAVLERMTDVPELRHHL